MTCINSFLFWLVLVAAIPGVFLGSFAAWFLVEWFRIYWMGKR
jgi:hypothetical protein